MLNVFLSRNVASLRTISQICHELFCASVLLRQNVCSGLSCSRGLSMTSPYVPFRRLDALRAMVVLGAILASVGTVDFALQLMHEEEMVPQNVVPVGHTIYGDDSCSFDPGRSWWGSMVRRR